MTVAVTLLDDHADVGLHQLGDVHDLQAGRDQRSKVSSLPPTTALRTLPLKDTNHLRLKEQVAALHHDLVGVGQRRSEGQDLLVGEDLQRPRLPTLVHGHGLAADAQPQLGGEGAVATLPHSSASVHAAVLRGSEMNERFLTSTSKRVEP